MEYDVRTPAAELSSTRIGAIVTWASARGDEWRGRVIGLEGETALVRLFEKLDFPSESPLHLTLVQCLPSREKMLFMLQKGTELGVDRFIPCTSSRSPVSAAHAKGQDKSHRWLATVEKAVEQSRRRVLPVVEPVTGFGEVIRRFGDTNGAKLLLYEKESETRLKDILSTWARPGKAVLVCGSEGGFAEDEVRWARRSGFLVVRLGGRTLRCETAAVAAVSIVQHLWGDL